MMCPTDSAPNDVTPSQYSILVVDDEQSTVNLLLRLLKSAGYVATGTTDGRAAIGHARANPPDLILCDVTMPEMDGYEVLKSLKRDPRTAIIPFIFLSGQHDHTHVRQGMCLGASDFLAKPFEPQELFDSIGARIEHHRTVSRKLEQLRASLTRAVPHEFFTPLNVILGFSMLTLDSLKAGDEIDREDLTESMRNIHTAGEQLLRIASNYVLYTELATCEGADITGSTALAPATWEPELARVMRRAALERERMPDLHYSFAPAALNLRQNMLEKLVLELLDNAFKFSREGAWVSVNGSVDGSFYLLRVMDRGSGMTAEQIESLAPMLQFDRPQQMKPGVGLGLSIARMIAERAGGSLELLRNEEKGLSVEVRLPITAKV